MDIIAKLYQVPTWAKNDHYKLESNQSTLPRLNLYLKPIKFCWDLYRLCIEVKDLREYLEKLNHKK